MALRVLRWIRPGRSSKYTLKHGQISEEEMRTGTMESGATIGSNKELLEDAEKMRLYGPHLVTIIKCLLIAFGLLFVMCGTIGLYKLIRSERKIEINRFYEEILNFDDLNKTFSETDHRPFDSNDIANKYPPAHVVKNVHPYNISTPEPATRRQIKSAHFQGATVIIHDLKYSHDGGAGTSNPGKSAFKKCKYKDCYLNRDLRLLHEADVVVYSYGDEEYLDRLQSNHTIVYHHTESPVNLRLSVHPPRADYIMSYRQDADFFSPYAMYKMGDQKWPFRIAGRVRNDWHGEMKNQLKDVWKPEIKGHTAVWTVSNCLTHNDRKSYVEELAKHTEIGLYGSCFDRPVSNQDLWTILDRSYFYLAFENSNCREYITEKFWINALGNGVIPVVMGAPRTDYEAVAPPNSFIHVDDFESPKKLAEFMNRVKSNKTLYNSYFSWRLTGHLYWTDELTLCNMCDKFAWGIKNERKPRDLKEYLRPETQCEPSKGLFAAANAPVQSRHKKKVAYRTIKDTDIGL